MPDSKKILIAKIQAHQGLKGWLKIYSYSESMQKFSNYDYFFVLNDKTYTRLDVDDIIFDKSIKIKFKNSSSREDNNKFIGKNLYIESSQLDSLKEGQFYWKDLIGLDVYIDNEQKIGTVSDIIETGANDVLVVKGDKDYLVPYIYGESVKEICLNNQKIIIDKIYYE